MTQSDDERERHVVAIAVLIEVEGVDYGDACSAGEQLVRRHLPQIIEERRESDGVEWLGAVQSVREIHSAIVQGDLSLIASKPVVKWMHHYEGYDENGARLDDAQ